MKLLKNRYKLEKMLGQGGFGEVYKGTDLQTGRSVAIKRSKLTSEVNKKRFQREYKFLNMIKHPNLVEAYDYMEHEQELFMMLEFVEGKSLREIVQGSKHIFSFSEQLAIAANICRAIEVLNKGGIIHRDIKPDNIMVNEKTGLVKLLDLGIGKNINEQSVELTADKSTIGTLAYMSPEQSNGNVNEKSDVFSLGVTLYQFLLWEDRSPFWSENGLLIISKIANYNPPTIYEKLQKDGLTQKTKKLCKDISTIIALSIEKDSKKRPSAATMAESFIRAHKQTMEKNQCPDKFKVLSQTIDPDLIKRLNDIRLEYKDEGTKHRKKRKTRHMQTRKRAAAKKESKWGMHLVYVSIIAALGISLLLFSGNTKEEKHGSKKMSKIGSSKELKKDIKRKSSSRKNSSKQLKKEMKKKSSSKKTRSSLNKQVDQLFNQGNLFVSQGKLEKALECYNKAIVLAPNDAYLYNNIGTIKYKLNKQKEALVDYNKAIKLNPKYSDAYCHRATIFHNQGLLEKALTDYNTAIALNPKYAKAYGQRGVLFSFQKKFTRALADYSKAIQLNPNYTDMYYSRAKILYLQGKFEKALNNCARAIQLNPKHADAYKVRGGIFQKQKKHKKAVADWKKALEINPFISQASIMRSYIANYDK